MVETYGIPRVVDAAGTSFGRLQIDRTPQPFVRPLTCGGRTCSASAVAVVGYLRLQTWVEPMYRLGPGAEHSAGCPFNVEARVGDLVKEPDAVLFCNTSFLLSGLKYFASDCAQVVVPASELTIELTGNSVKLNAATAATSIVPVTGALDAGAPSGSTTIKWYRGKGTANEKSSTFSLVVPPPGC